MADGLRHLAEARPLGAPIRVCVGGRWAGMTEGEARGHASGPTTRPRSNRTERADAAGTVKSYGVRSVPAHPSALAPHSVYATPPNAQDAGGGSKHLTSDNWFCSPPLSPFPPAMAP